MILPPPQHFSFSEMLGCLSVPAGEEPPGGSRRVPSTFGEDLKDTSIRTCGEGAGGLDGNLRDMVTHS